MDFAIVDSSKVPTVTGRASRDPKYQEFLGVVAKLTEGKAVVFPFPTTDLNKENRQKLRSSIANSVRAYVNPPKGCYHEIRYAANPQGDACGIRVGCVKGVAPRVGRPPASGGRK